MFDHSELDALARDLMAAPLNVIPALVPVANKAGVNMKRVMKSDASGHSHAPTIARTVNYEVEVDGASISIEVGFDKEMQTGKGKFRTPGNLANILAFGTSKNAPVMDITRGLTEEVPNFMRWCAKVGSEAL